MIQISELLGLKVYVKNNLPSNLIPSNILYHTHKQYGPSTYGTLQHHITIISTLVLKFY